MKPPLHTGDGHANAEALLEKEKLFSNMMIESMPGIIYLYNEHGRFLRWNRNFEAISGYSAEEIARMHPVDFFEGAEKILIQQRIDIVLSKGESFVEANFVTRNGRAMPYFFTGKRIVLDGEVCLVGMGIDISERKQVENLLAESERRYRELVERANSIILCWNSEGCISFLNEFGQRVFGYTAEEIVGRHVMDTIVPPTESGGRDLRRLMEQVCADPKAFEQNVNENMRRDGTHLWIAWTNRIVSNEKGELIEILSVGTDITEKKRAEEALQKSEERYHTTLDGIMEGCQLIGYDWRYLYLNDAAAIHNRRSNAELMGRTMMEAWPGIETTGVHAMLARCMKERIALHEETDFIFPDGADGWFDVRCQPVPEGIFVLSIDISERRQAEDEVRRLNAELEQRVVERTAQLESANKELEAFSYSVSHDLRAPLRTVNGFAEIVLEDYGPLLPEKGRRDLGRIRDGGRHMGELIDDLLAFARLSRQPLSRRPVDTAKLVKNVLEDLEPELAGRAVDIRTGDLPPCYGDPALLTQVWVNLLSNAVKYTRGREPAVVEIGCIKKDAEVIYFVRDNGTGFDMKYVHKLFGVFQRLHRADEFEGTGVGLAIVQRIVHRHGGRVWVEAEKGRGATFYFTLEGGENT